jgi:hypothetical protein
VKGLHDRNEVLEARLAVLQHILANGEDKLDLTENWEKGVLDLRCGGGCLPYMEVRDDCIIRRPLISTPLFGFAFSH